MVLPARALVLPARALVLVLLGGAARIAALPARYDSVSVITARPPDARLVDAAQFGAVGDGVADDTDALQRAINATYGAGLPDCTIPGARLVALEGGGRRYRVTAPLRLWIWVRLVGYGASRPQLVLAGRTPGTFVSEPVTEWRVAPQEAVLAKAYQYMVGNVAISESSSTQVSSEMRANLDGLIALARTLDRKGVDVNKERVKKNFFNPQRGNGQGSGPAKFEYKRGTDMAAQMREAGMFR